MKCPECEKLNFNVTSSRRNVEGYKVRHRRCLDCGLEYSTIELPVTIYKRLKNIRKRLVLLVSEE